MSHTVIKRTNSINYQTAILDVPVTVQRPPYNPATSGSNKRLYNAGTARVNRAASTDAPDGTPGWVEKHSNQTVLQQHCAFFDSDEDGIIWPTDTFWGFYALGFGVILSLVSVLIIHPTFSYPTGHGWIPDPFFRIYVENIHKGKHGSDTGSYDSEGRFVPQKFEDWFSKYGHGKDGLTWADIWDGLHGQRVLMDPFGSFGALFEWFSMYYMLWPEDGVIKKEDVRRLYDGSLFFDIAAKRANKKPHNTAGSSSSWGGLELGISMILRRLVGLSVFLWMLCMRLSIAVVRILSQRP